MHDRLDRVVCAVPRSSLNEQQRPAIAFELDATARAEARAELEYIAAPTVILMWAVAIALPLRALSHVFAWGEETDTLASIAALVAFALVGLIVTVRLCLGLAEGRNRFVRFGARIAVTGMFFAMGYVMELEPLSLLWAVQGCVLVPLVYLALLSRLLPDYALSRWAWLERNVGRSSLGALYGARAPLAARIAWALSRGVVRSAILRRAP